MIKRYNENKETINFMLMSRQPCGEKQPRTLITPSTFLTMPAIFWVRGGLSTLTRIGRTGSFLLLMSRYVEHTIQFCLISSKTKENDRQMDKSALTIIVEEIFWL